MGELKVVNSEEERLNKQKEIETHIYDIMNILDIPNTESNRRTPYRIAKMLEGELFKNRNNMGIEELEESMTMFPNAYYNDMIIVKDIPFSSTCEHHWLPFTGKVTVGYIARMKVVGLSKIPRVVKYFSKKPQLQEQLCSEIGEFLFQQLDPFMLCVLMESEHQCVKCRGAESDCSTRTFRYWTRESNNQGVDRMLDNFWRSL